VPRKPGRYRAIAEVPGNLLSEGMFSVGIALSTFEPVVIHFWERGALAFQVHDAGEGASARGTFAGRLPGAVRPMLSWTTLPLPAPEANR
jgi:lipopolysaccharide transport system ATP-binding protein